jgi:hypothetical protein
VLKVKFTQEIEAEVVATVRLADGKLQGAISATCLYAPKELKGATASASVAIPKEHAEKIQALLEDALKKASQELGERLAQSKAVAFKVSVAQKEIR